MKNSSIVPLTPIEYEDVPNILLLGNGISRTYNAKSWDTIIKDCISKYSASCSFEEIKNMPANMQIVVATNNNVDKELACIQKSLIKVISEEEKSLIRVLDSLKIADVLTTNYDYNIEQAFGCKCSSYSFQQIRRWTKEVTDKEGAFNLFQYSKIEESDHVKRIWHIHGDICRKNSMVMGHYYYGKLLYQLQNHLQSSIQTVKTNNSKRISFKPTSWVDYFMVGNVYILGLNMYLTETDLWWLLECKKRNFPDTKVVFYQAEQKKNCNIEMMMNLLDNVEIIYDIPLLNENYEQFYKDIIFDINTRISTY